MTTCRTHGSLEEAMAPRRSLWLPEGARLWKTGRLPEGADPLENRQHENPHRGLKLQKPKPQEGACQSLENWHSYMNHTNK